MAVSASVRTTILGTLQLLLEGGAGHAVELAAGQPARRGGLGLLAPGEVDDDADARGVGGEAPRAPVEYRPHGGLGVAQLPGLGDGSEARARERLEGAVAAVEHDRVEHGRADLLTAGHEQVAVDPAAP